MAMQWIQLAALDQLLAHAMAEMRKCYPSSGMAYLIRKHATECRARWCIQPCSFSCKITKILG